RAFAANTHHLMRSHARTDNAPSKQALVTRCGDGQPAKDTIFSDTCRRTAHAECEWGEAMPTIRPKTNKRPKQAAMTRRSVKRGAKLSSPRSRAAAEIGEIVRMRAEAEAAIAEARKSHERLRQAIEILPQGIVFLDAEGRYILWNKKYSEIYSRSSDLFERGPRPQDTIRIGVERGDYPEAIGREEEWLAQRLARLSQPGERHEQT